jgi:hypothetical protein
MPAPDGALRLDRAAVVQHTALEARAMAGVWIEIDQGSAEVCVVSADGKQFRHAPLDSAAPRVFAAIAASLLDEILVPPEVAMPSVNVDVHVDIDQGAPRQALAAPIISTAAIASVATLDRARTGQTLIELGPTVSPVSYGLEAEVAFPLMTPALRLGAVGSASRLFNGGFNDQTTGSLFAVGAELRYVGRGTTHFDVGVMGGAAKAGTDDDIGGVVSVRLSLVREGEGSGVALSLAPTWLLGFRGNSPILTGALASLKWELPL